MRERGFFGDHSVLMGLLHKGTGGVLMPAGGQVVTSLLRFTGDFNFVHSCGIFFVTRLSGLLLVHRGQLQRFSVLAGRSVGGKNSCY